jgi:hypothetical protein
MTVIRSKGIFCERNLPLKKTCFIGKRYGTVRPSKGILCERNLSLKAHVIGKMTLLRPSKGIFCERNLPLKNTCYRKNMTL